MLGWFRIAAESCTKDAAQCFDSMCEEPLTKMGYTAGVFSPCLYQRKATKVVVFRHGDDFVRVGTRAWIRAFKADLSAQLIVKKIGHPRTFKSFGQFV